MRPFPDALESERLVIRPVDPASAMLVNAAIRESFRELHEWMPWAERLPSLAETEAHLLQQQERFRSGADCALGIWLRSTDAFVGGTGLHPRLPDPASREIGYWIHSAHAGRGLATEAVRALAAAALGPLGLARLQIKASERNVASQRVALRSGFLQEAILDDGRVDPGGHPSRTVVFVRTREHQAVIAGATGRSTAG